MQRVTPVNASSSVSPVSNGSPAVTKTNANKFNECAKLKVTKGEEEETLTSSTSE